MSSNVLASQINLVHSKFFMSKALMRIKRLQSSPIFICDVCFPRVGNDRKRCPLDDSLFLSFFLIFIYEGEISESGSQNEWLLVIGPYMD